MFIFCGFFGEDGMVTGYLYETGHGLVCHMLRKKSNEFIYGYSVNIATDNPFHLSYGHNI